MCSRRRARRPCRQPDDHRVGALDDPLRAAAWVIDRRFGHLRGRIEWHELHHLRRVENGLALGGRANGSVDRILTAIGTGQRGERQNMRFVEAGHRTNGCHCQRVLGQRSRLVGAQDIHRRRFIHRRKARRQNAQLCQRARTERRCKREGGRQRDRDRCKHRRQHEGDDLGERHPEIGRVGDQQHDDDAVERSEIAHHAQHRFLLRAHDMRGANELGGAAELGAHAGRRDLRHCLATPDQRPCIGLHAGAGFDGHGFAGEHGLIEQDFSAGEVHIRGDHAAETKASPRRPGRARPRVSSVHAPSRRTVAFSASRDFSAARVAWARLSWNSPSAALNTKRPAMIAAST